MGKINLLPPKLSARIAAGEVIDRPQAILREFLDNALDTNTDEIAVTIDGGGIDRIKVRDWGEGIKREDLEIIASPHATSKIKEEDDLYRIKTLGFRGEALYSIASVAKLTVSTCDSSSGTKSTITIDNGERGAIISTGPDKGTEVTSENLFFDIPARRSFLKRPSTEALMCKNLLISKALAFPEVGFTLRIDGALKIRWPKGQTLKERVMMLYREYSIAEGDVYYLEETKDDYSIKIVATGSGVKRTDKKEIRVYVNGRPVDEYSIVQAVLYGYGELLPGGSYPYASVFINDRPEMVDFNIHPAKREVKIRNGAEIHHSVSSLIKNGIERKIPEIKSETQFYLFDGVKRSENERETESYGRVIKEKDKTPNEVEKPKQSQSEEIKERITPYVNRDKEWLEKAKKLRETREEVKKEKVEAAEKEDDEITYIGQAFKLFLICERKGVLYLVDQHAAHERILYDELLSQSTLQALLVPIKIEVDDLTNTFLENNSYVYTKLGIMLAEVRKGEWEIDAIPAMCRGIEDKIIDFVTSAKLDEHELEERLFATMACKAAIKMGDEVDKYSAMEILKKVFEMDEPCCPHGRTFLIKLTKENLMKMVGRTV